MSQEFVKPLTELKIATFEVAQKRLLKKLIDSGFHLQQVFPINQNRYSILIFKEKRILLMFKKEVFFNFGLEFRSKRESGVGETVNYNELKTALRMGVNEIYSVFPNGICYKININDFLMKCHKRIVKEGKEVRSINIHNFKRFCDLRK